MSQVPYSANFVGLLPTIGNPELINKKMMLTTAIATDAQDTFPMHLSYYAGLEARAVQDDDMVLASGSLKATTSNGAITFFSDASMINVVVSSEHVAKGVVDPASDATCVITATGVCLRLEPGDRGFLFETGAWNTEQSTIQKWSCLWRFPDTRRWVNTSPPSANSPAQVRGQLIGQENGIPVLRIDELTYLPKLAGSTPRRTTQASASNSPTTGRIFGGRKRKFGDAAGDATDHSAEAGPSSPSKRARGNAGSNTLLHKLQIAAAEASPSPPPADDTSPPSPTPPAVTSVPAPVQVRAITRSASKRVA